MRCTFIIAIAVLLGFGLTACDRDEDESDLQSSIRLLAPTGDVERYVLQIVAVRMNPRLEPADSAIYHNQCFHLS